MAWGNLGKSRLRKALEPRRQGVKESFGACAPQARREQSQALPRLPDLTFICVQKPVDLHDAL